jgi:hypothetical protein
LYQYLKSLPLDSAQPLGPKLAVLPYYPESVPRLPFAVITDGIGGIVRPAYGNTDLMYRLVTVGLYQAPLSTPEVPPNSTLLVTLWNLISDAPHHVDADHSGNRFVDLQRSAEQMPIPNADRGLEGYVRFRMLYQRV